MNRFLSYLWACVIACVIIPVAWSPAWADHIAETGPGTYQYTYGRRFHSGYLNPSRKADYMVADGLIARPIGFAATLVGTGIYIATLPFSLLGGNAAEAGATLVGDPARYTFQRCLGCLYRDYTVPRSAQQPTVAAAPVEIAPVPSPAIAKPLAAPMRASSPARIPCGSNRTIEMREPLAAPRPCGIPTP